MDVFISYAREDKDRAHRVASALQARGWSVWWDRDVKAGQAFDQVIERELETAKSVIVLWSKYSIASEWVKNEAAVALQRGVLVPALIDTVKVPLEFSRRHTADLVGWDGDISHPGFQALCDGVTETGVSPASTPTTSANRPATRRSWTHRIVLKGRWQTLPGILLAAAAFLAALTAFVAALNQWTPRRADRGGIQPIADNPPAATAPSTDRDNPTRLTSKDIRGTGVGERISYYYAFNAEPGVIRVTAESKNKYDIWAKGIHVVLYDKDAKAVLEVGLPATTDGERVVREVQIFRQQPITMRVLLDTYTVDYMVRVEGSVDFTALRK
jgi:TIR domain